MNSRMIGVRKRIEQHDIDNAEERRVGADPERQCDDGYNREAGFLQQHADAIMQVLSHLFEPSPSPHPALDFFDQTGVAEFPARRLFRLFYRLTALYSVAHGHFKMRSDLLFELPFLLSSPPKWEPHP